MNEKTLEYYCNLLMQGENKEALSMVKADILTDISNRVFRKAEEDQRYSREAFQLAYDYINKVFNTIVSGSKRYTEQGKKKEGEE